MNNSVIESKCLDSKYECPICLSLLKKPILTSCGHRFCNDCIFEWFKKKGNYCPIDNERLDSPSDVFLDNYTKREIQERFTELNFSEIETNINQNVIETSNDSLISCYYDKFGCDNKFTTTDDLDSHLHLCINKHLLLLSHNLCKFNALKSENNKSIESTLWEPVKTHSNDLQELLKLLYERIVLLEQKNRENDIIINNLNEQLRILKNDLSIKYCNGCFIWRITDFRAKLENLTNDANAMFYSPGFYSSPNGYKLCARISLSRNVSNFLSIFIHLKKSKNDEYLEWPFRGRISITLVHPLCARKSIKEIMLTNSNLDSMKRPILDFNLKGFGYNEYIPVTNLFSDNFVQNDELVIKIDVKSV